MPLPHRAGSLKVRVRVGAQAYTATLLDAPTSRDFASLLPLTLSLEDYAAAEKIAYLPMRRKLSLSGAPAGSDASPGSISYYAPWGNLALFYKGAPYAAGLVRLGSFDAPPGWLAARGPLKATIELVGK